MTSTITARPITDRQRSFLTSLVWERHSDAEEANAILETVDTMTTREASAEIDRMLRMPKVSQLRSQAPQGRSQGTAAEEGVYVLDGKVYKVVLAVHGSGRPYAKVLTKDDGFTIARGMVYRLGNARRLTVDEARKYGALYGRCAVCGATLTDEESMAQGIGPVCATRL